MANMDPPESQSSQLREAGSLRVPVVLNGSVVPHDNVVGLKYENSLNGDFPEYAEREGDVVDQQPSLDKLGELKRRCRFVDGPTLADGSLSPTTECGVELRGADENDLKRVFETHLALSHPPQFRQENDKVVSNCTWLYQDGTICSELIKQHSERRPCYALAEHVGKKIDHFAFRQ
ncbi:uncharacterized protein B0H18DRAFT_956472 [Fomitopsis serialis]|uniref:uncharacterized protein n=1 Tax=Fomitopsis serialis TaxID=139415 RepID=UPI0020081160|nr:uncharacterized protein B0H18DRAFT_956472 [Neoantrodia serialis]KAH9921893.1 hypothetical protein B0H18DRAFT_956472 [Neoantrodia serialis]